MTATARSKRSSMGRSRWEEGDEEAAMFAAEPSRRSSCTKIDDIHSFNYCYYKYFLQQL